MNKQKLRALKFLFAGITAIALTTGVFGWEKLTLGESKPVKAQTDSIENNQPLESKAPQTSPEIQRSNQATPLLFSSTLPALSSTVLERIEKNSNPSDLQLKIETEEKAERPLQEIEDTKKEDTKKEDIKTEDKKTEESKSDDSVSLVPNPAQTSASENEANGNNNTEDKAEESAAEDPPNIGRLSAYISKDLYYPGESVVFGLKNNSDKTYLLRDSAPWYVLRVKDNKVIYAPLALQAIFPLKPDEQKEWKWHQEARTGETIEAGEYQIVFSHLERSVSFRIFRQADNRLVEVTDGSSPNSPKESEGDSISVEYYSAKI